MSSLGASLGSVLGMGRSPKLPPLPPGLGLPEKSGFIGRPKGESYGGEGYNAQLAKANTYNKAFADLLNNQPQLTGSERTQIYAAYSDKFIPISYKKVDPGYQSQNKSSKAEPEHLFYDYSKNLSQLNPDQYAAQQQAQQEPQAAPAPAPAPVQQAPAPAPVAAPPQTVGPVATPPPTTPVTATPEGNIAGSTKTTVSADTSTAGTGASRGRRGRMATLLTGLGGAVERFGL